MSTKATDITETQINALWEAANAHSIVTIGEYLDPDFEGDDIPPRPSADKVVEQATDYLNSVI